MEASAEGTLFDFSKVKAHLSAPYLGFGCTHNNYTLKRFKLSLRAQNGTVENCHNLFESLRNLRRRLQKLPKFLKQNYFEDTFLVAKGFVYLPNVRFVETI